MKPQLDSLNRELIKIALSLDVKPDQLAKKYNVHPRTIKNIGKKDNTKRKKYDNSTRFKITAENELKIKEFLKETSKASGGKIKEELHLNASSWTINRSIKRMGIKTCAQKKQTNDKPDVDDNRYEYCIDKLGEIRRMWNSSGESTIDTNDSRKRAFREDKNKPENKPKKNQSKKNQC